MSDTDSLLILMFAGTSTAATAYDQLIQMEKQHLVRITDAVIIERDSGEDETVVAPGSGQGVGAAVIDADDANFRVVQTHGKQGKHAAGGASAGLGAVTGAVKDFGIDDDSLDAIRRRLQPNSSALFVLGHADDPDTFVAGLRIFEPEIFSTTLTPEVEKELRARLIA